MRLRHSGVQLDVLVDDPLSLCLVWLERPYAFLGRASECDPVGPGHHVNSDPAVFCARLEPSRRPEVQLRLWNEVGELPLDRCELIVVKEVARP